MFVNLIWLVEKIMRNYFVGRKCRDGGKCGGKKLGDSGRVKWIVLGVSLG